MVLFATILPWSIDRGTGGKSLRAVNLKVSLGELDRKTENMIEKAVESALMLTAYHISTSPSRPKELPQSRSIDTFIC